MNANELAACLDMRVVYGLPLAEAAAMLREQQRTIDGDKRLINLLYEKERQQQAEIEALKAKTLTEQDLDKLVKDAEDGGYMDMYITGLIDGFNHARAILKKASEK